MKNLLTQLSEKADQLNPRERRLVTLAGLTLLLALTWTVLLQPAIETLKGAQAKQTAQLQQAARVQRAAQELDSLRGTQSRVVLQKDDTLPRLSKLVASSGIGNSGRLEQLEDGSIELVLSEAPAGSVLMWLAQSEALTNLRLLEMELQKPDAGLLNGRILMTVNHGGKGS